MARTKRSITGMGAAVLLAAGTGAVAWTQLASAADSTTIYACVNNSDGTLRLVTATTTCKTNEHLVTWSVTGPQGPAGPAGPQGPAGPAGTGTPPEKVVGFLKLDGVEGSSAAKGFEKQIEIYSFSFGVTQTTTVTSGGGAGSGKANVSDIHLSKHSDAASVALLKQVLNGTHIATGQLTLCDPSDCAATTTEVYALQDILVTADQHAAPTGTEAIALTFNKLTYTAGGESVSYDKATGTAG